MKKLIFILAIMIVAPIAAIQAQINIAVIDLQKVFTDYYKTQDAQRLITTRSDQFKKEMQEMQTDFQKLVDETQKLRDQVTDQALTEAARKERQKAFEAKVKQVQDMERKIQEFQNTRLKQFDEQSARMRQNILEEINKVVQKFAADSKFNLVLDISGKTFAGTNLVLYNQGQRDITEEILKQLNANRPASSNPAPAKPAGQ
jgi:outer membrane protein